MPLTPSRREALEKNGHGQNGHQAAVTGPSPDEDGGHQGAGREWAPFEYQPGRGDIWLVNDITSRLWPTVRILKALEDVAITDVEALAEWVQKDGEGLAEEAQGRLSCLVMNLDLAVMAVQNLLVALVDSAGWSDQKDELLAGVPAREHWSHMVGWLLNLYANGRKVNGKA